MVGYMAYWLFSLKIEKVKVVMKDSKLVFRCRQAGDKFE